MAGMPELGSKISLISKADIRYEGRLFTVDPQECTIALANVRSFGTEDRENQFPVAPQNQVYEYILFRGSDIKDIRVITPVSNLPNDPAIVQMTVPTSLGGQTLQQPGYGPSMMSQLNAFNSHYGSGLMGNVATVSPVVAAYNKKSTDQSSKAPGDGNLPSSSTSVMSGFNEVLNKQRSRSNTPLSNLLNRRSPTIDQGTQASGGPNQQQRQKPVAKNDKKLPPQQQLNRNAAYQGQQQQQQRGRGGGGWINQRGNLHARMGRGRGGGGGGQRNNAASNQRAKNTLKFDNDYDFEQANTEFEELRLQLSKVEIDKKEDSGTETGARDEGCNEGPHEPEESHSHENQVIHYDKSKSFFDNISCEAVERSKGRSQRTDWRMERKLNSETFGITSVRRGGFRGRGFYLRNMHKPNFRGMDHNYGGDEMGQRMPNMRGNYRNHRGGGMRKQPGNHQNNAEEGQSQNESHGKAPNQRNRLMT